MTFAGGSALAAAKGTANGREFRTRHDSDRSSLHSRSFAFIRGSNSPMKSFQVKWIFIVLVLASVVRLSAAPPNIVLIISDDHGWSDYGFMGHSRVRTPHLD